MFVLLTLVPLLLSCHIKLIICVASNSAKDKSPAPASLSMLLLIFNVMWKSTGSQCDCVSII